MQTLTLVVIGLIVLAAFWLAGRMFGEGGRKGAAVALRVFLPVWLVAAVANLAIGYYVAERQLWMEIPVFIAVFGIPAAAAIMLLRLGNRPRDVA
jgi:hypothetical protein